jgi:hypothetical protein
LVAVDWYELPEVDSTGAPIPVEEEPPPAVTPDSAALGDVPAPPVPPARPRADAQDFVLTGDSLEVNAPGGELEWVSAAGGARGESSARDSLNTSVTPTALRTDWIEGDTIIAEFERVFAGVDSPSDEDDRVTLRRLTAAGTAKSLYRLDPVSTSDGSSAVSDSAVADSLATDTTGVAEEPAAGDSLLVRPAEAEEEAEDEAEEEGEGVQALEDVREPLPLHFVAGDRIIITMRNGEIEQMEVEGQTRGLYLEPNIDRMRGASTPGTGQGERG